MRQSATCHYRLLYSFVVMLSDVCLNMKLSAFTLKQQRDQLIFCYRKIPHQQSFANTIFCLIEEENVVQSDFQKVETGFLKHLTARGRLPNKILQHRPALYGQFTVLLQNWNLRPNRALIMNNVS